MTPIEEPDNVHQVNMMEGFASRGNQNSLMDTSRRITPPPIATPVSPAPKVTVTVEIPIVDRIDGEDNHREVEVRLAEDGEVFIVTNEMYGDGIQVDIRTLIAAYKALRPTAVLPTLGDPAPFPPYIPQHPNVTPNWPLPGESIVRD